MRSSEMLSNEASRRVWTARRTSSGPATRSSTSSRRGANVCAPSEMRVTPPSRRSAPSSGVTVSGFASTVTSAAAGNAASRRRSASGSVNVGVPPPTKTVGHGIGEHARLPARARAATPRRRRRAAPVRPTTVTKSQIAAAVRAERQVDVEMADAGRAPARSVARTRSPGPRPHELHELPDRSRRHRPSRQQGDDVVQVIGEHAATRYFFLSPSRLSTARKASCGTSTPPTCFIRFLPFFCFSSSLRLREMSPP